MHLNSKPSATRRRFSPSKTTLGRALGFLIATIPLLSSAQPADDAFPYTWFGEWKGDSHYLAVGGDTMAFGMEVHIGPIIDSTRVQWKIVYIQNGQRQERPYSLIIEDASAGRYIIDEHNSITIPSALIGETLYSHFGVGSAQLTTSYHRNGNEMIVEMLSMNAGAPEVSGGEGDTPEVTTYPVRGIQRAVLSRVN